MKKLLCSILAVATAISFASCEFKSPAKVIKVNGEDISSGIYLIYQFLAYSNAANISDEGEKDLLKQTIKELPAPEWIHKETLNGIKNHVFIANTFKEKGFSFTEDELATIKTQAEDNYNANSKMFAKNGIGLETYTEFFISSRQDEKLLEDFKAKDENKVTDSDIKNYTDENYAHVARVNFPSTDKDSKELTDEQKKTVADLASQLSDKVNAGETLNSKLAEDYIKKALEAVGREFTETSIDSYFATSYLSEDAVSYYYTDEIKAEMIASALGAAKIIDNNGIPYVWGRIESFPTEEKFNENKDSIAMEMQSKAYIDAAKQITDAYAIEEDASAVKYYSLKKVKLT